MQRSMGILENQLGCCRVAFKCLLFIKLILALQVVTEM